MNDYLFRKIINGREYVVNYDLDYDFNEKGFDTDEECEEYLQKVQRNEISAYVVSRMEKCPACEHWHEIDWVCGIEAEDPEEAVDYAVNDGLI